MLKSRLWCLLFGCAGFLHGAAVASADSRIPFQAEPDNYLLVVYPAQDPDVAIRAGMPETPLRLQTIDGYQVARIPTARCDDEGALSLRLGKTLRGTAETPLGLYLLPAWPDRVLKGRNRLWFRRQSLASREYTDNVAAGTLKLDRFSPVHFQTAPQGRMQRLGVFSENFLHTAGRQPLIYCGDQPAPFDRMSDRTHAGGTSYTLQYHDPKNTANDVTVKLMPHADRLRVGVTYKVNEAVDHDVPVHVRLPFRQPVETLWGVSWRFWRPNLRESIGEKRFRDGQQEGSLYVHMAQGPIAIARGQDGGYIGVIDHNLSNLVTEVRRTQGQPDVLNVSTYLWPRERGRTYQWEFELTAGYENLYNATLRALWPYTRENTELYQGVLGREIVLSFIDLNNMAWNKGFRAIWHHRWFRRNGDYFDPRRAMTEPYETVWTHGFSYDLLKRNVERVHADGHQVYVYFQFAGISEDMMHRYEADLVRDQQGKPIRAGIDGRIDNIWMYPDPERDYGRTVLRQIAELLDAVNPDGIALDRADRFDWTYGDDQFDYGHFNGYSSIFEYDGARRPVASVAIAGRAWLQELRSLLDSRGKKLVINSGAHLFPINLSDAHLVEAGSNPTCLLFAKAFGNGKSTSYTVRGRTNDALNNFVANLCQGYPYHKGRLERPIHVDDMTAPVEFQADQPRGRLLYAISEDGDWPTLWYFNNGYTRMRYDPDEEPILKRFRGSEFVPAARR